MRKRARPREFRSGALDRRSPPYRLYEKAKQFLWDPAEIDLTQDAADWPKLSGEEQDFLLRALMHFRGAEEAVTYDLLPFLHVVAAEQRLEEELFLTSFVRDEAAHTDFFYRYFEEVVGDA